MKTNRHRSEAALCGEAGTEGVDRTPAIGGLIGESVVMREVRRDIEIAASLDLSVLITGEPGTGKELVARGIHNASSRRGKPFVAVNCAAINPNLIESELFGHEKGAYTGAGSRHVDLIEEAQGGTVFFDEFGKLPQRVQVKLLCLLQDRCIRRVGSTRPIEVDVLVVAATNRDLDAMVASE